MTFKSIALVSALVVIAAAGGYFTSQYMGRTANTSLGNTSDSTEPKIAYWVAPMDASFQRDEPGLSPMGMELVPVYEDDGGGEGEPSIRINPAVVNNIGVRTETVTLGHISHGVETLGTIMPDEEGRSDIHTRTEGWVERLAVESEGETVRKGELLFEIYAPSLVTAQSEYLQGLKIGRESFTLAGEERLRSLGSLACARQVK